MAPQVRTCDDCHLSLFRPAGRAWSVVPLPVRTVHHLAVGSELRHFAPDDRLNVYVLRRESTWLGRPGVSGASGRPVGLVGAAILARLGEDRARSPEPSVLPAKAGLAPVTRSSGRTRSVRFRYAAKEPPVARRLHAVGLHLDPALTLARSAYDAVRARGQQHHRALRNAAARWVCVLWRCLQDQTPYEPARHLGAARAA